MLPGQFMQSEVMGEKTQNLLTLLRVFHSGPAACERLAGDIPCDIMLLTSSQQIGHQLRGGTRGRIERAMAKQRIDLRTSARVVSVNHDSITLADNTRLDCDIVLWATDATAPPLLSQLGLPQTAEGFLRVRPTLQSVGRDNVFAVGDSATFDDFSIPKAGVYAVREGPVLWRNLNHCLENKPLEPYEPQSDFLRLINTGDRSAIGEYRGWSFEGRWVWKRKDRIDTRFMDMYQAYAPPAMMTPSIEPARKMRCAGCGGKIAGSTLSRVLARLDVPTSPQVAIGLDRPDDAAVILPSPGHPLTVTVDYFSSPLDDPYFLGRIAALHAASDLFAFGARPIAALAMATIPEGSPRKQEQLLYEILSGSLRELRAMNATLVGGHTIEGPELTVGFTMLADQGTVAPRTKAGLRIGDRLVLTKPLGTGVLLAAHQQAACRAAWMESLQVVMLQSNQTAASFVEEFDIQGVTDVTGFGLAGHLLEMLRAANVGACIQLHRLPFLPGAIQLAEQGLESSLAPDNRAAETDMAVPESLRLRGEYRLLFDPQTCGGLLLGVPANRLEAFLDRMNRNNPGTAVTIGAVTAPSLDGGLLRIEP